MDSDTIWRHVDEQRLDVADLLDTLTDDQFATGSLCVGWSVRDVAVHLTQAHMPPSRVLGAMVRSGLRFNVMVHRLAVDDPTPARAAADKLRAMVGSRRHAMGTTEMEPLLDVLIHGQDIAVPVGISRSMPPDAAGAVAQRLWPMRFPFHPRRDHTDVRFIATDVDLEFGAGRPVEAPIRDIVMVFAGRPAAAGVLAGLDSSPR
ncbi:maleylpyruvate isomerase family mycothiol-dependent enzyme [Gordonia sp. LSe1-13]|uniref:Maleylpyruvate isomerase family mycothiol-dependent enzyme n=1 Tax=Gordonia sesuvii TaxID=3116777 RepID=A0ABU7MHX1_9ACTN|nr:maleylpyruvate isomerase family mycothiol-dependent enzyme [Gordonia sp. LSe1-13]